MSDRKNLLTLAGVAGATLLGALFFFVIIGVFGLSVAITGLLVFVVGSLLICRATSAEGANL